VQQRGSASGARTRDADLPTRIVTTHYRYKPPPRKRKEAAPLTVEPIPSRPAIVRKAKPCNDNRPDPAPHGNDVAKSAIVTVRRRGKWHRACASYASSRMLVHDNWAVARVTPSAAGPGYPRSDGERR
jgi:hypothetical protein